MRTVLAAGMDDGGGDGEAEDCGDEDVVTLARTGSGPLPLEAVVTSRVGAASDTLATSIEIKLMTHPIEKHNSNTVRTVLRNATSPSRLHRAIFNPPVEVPKSVWLAHAHVTRRLPSKCKRSSQSQSCSTKIFMFPISFIDERTDSLYGPKAGAQ
ncbi:MAG: hypothetical protein QOJ19_4864 [Acidimicrobiia bacterium]|jgi:hypothetical protein|nr:hypothetical protein [Acidimicrobiia bacterium]